MRYQCLLCPYIYDENNGDHTSGIAPGVKWQDLPEDWLCPDCGASKEDFELIVE